MNLVQWNEALVLARSNGWNPKGTTLDFDFHYSIEVSNYDELPLWGEEMVKTQITEKCRTWPGGYLSAEYQIVTDEDAHALRQALERTDVDRSFLEFLELGAFRIGG